MQVLHVIERESVAGVLREGLRYGSRGVFGQDRHIADVNAYLDAVRPPALRDAGVSRTKCLYMYLLWDGKVHDIQTGRARPLAEWLARQLHAVLQVMIEPGTACFSDLDAYDAVAAALAAGAAPETLDRLAARYWRRVLLVQDGLRNYRPQAGGLTRRQAAPRTLPAVFARFEIMVTTNVKPAAITVIRP